MKEIENKEIQNWEALIEEKGSKKIALPLPGCIIKGEISGKNAIEFVTKDVDLSNSIVVDLEGQKYFLADAKREYLNNIYACIEVGKEERDGEER